jgi:hypothetical protein
MTKKGPVLKLTIEESGERCRVVAEFDTSACEIEVAMLPKDFRQNLGPLQEAILQCPGARRSLRSRRESVTELTSANNAKLAVRDAAGVLSADERIVQEIGSQLFDFIFQRRVLELYERCFKTTKNVQPLLIRLHVKHPGLSYVPWETLYDKKHRFYVTTSQKTPFVRAVDDDSDPKRSASRPIRILGMAARVKVLNGIALDQIEVDAEQVAIKNALGDLDDGIRAKLSWIPSAKVRDLNQRFKRGDGGQRWDIFHFIGHGGHDAEKGMGFIVVQEQSGSRGARLYADDLRTFLTQPGQTPSLVILNSCSGAQGEPGFLFSSTAAELIHGGVAAVIAMQFEISDNMGIAFAETFYTHLVEKSSIQSALAHTRAELKARQFGEWISPVLYMRDLDGEIFVESGNA